MLNNFTDRMVIPMYFCKIFMKLKLSFAAMNQVKFLTILTVQEFRRLWKLFRL